MEAVLRDTRKEGVRLDRQRVIERIRQVLRETERPRDAFLQGSHEGCEPGESVALFMGIAGWLQLNAAILDMSDTAFSFFSKGISGIFSRLI